MDKLARYKVLAAALALERFTVADLERFSGVSSDTIRTVLRREEKYLERIGTQRSGHRGGRPIRYHVKGSCRASLGDELRQLEGLNPDFRGTDSSALVSRDVLAAEDLLLDQLPRARNWTERRTLLAVAEADYRSALALEGNATPAITARLATIDLLLRISRTEDTLYEPKPLNKDCLPVGAVRAARSEMGPTLAKIRADLLDLLSSELPRNDFRLNARVLKRIYDSELGATLAQVGDSDEAAREAFKLLVVSTDAPGHQDKDLDSFVKQTLRSSKIPFQRTVAPDPTEHPDWTPGIAHFFGAAAYCVIVGSSSTAWQPMVQSFYSHFGSLRNFVFVIGQSTPQILNTVSAREGRVLLYDGLEPDGLVGAIGGALDAGPPKIIRSFDDEITYSHAVEEQTG